MTVAQLKDKPSQPALTPSFSTTGVRSAAARLLGGNGGKALSFVGGGGYSKTSNGSSRSSHFGGSNGTHYTNSSSHGGKGFFLVFNVGDTVYISDLNSPDKVNLVFFGMCLDFLLGLDILVFVFWEFCVKGCGKFVCRIL